MEKMANIGENWCKLMKIAGKNETKIEQIKNALKKKLFVYFILFFQVLFSVIFFILVST